MRSTSGSQLPSRLLRGLVCALALGMAPLSPALADEAEVDQQIDNLLGDPAIFKTTITDLQERVANEDSIAFSAFVDYPITVTINGKRRTIRSAEEFEPLYHDIVTPEIADVIVSQDYGSLFVNGDGIMFGDGQVWMNGICLDDACSEMEARIITLQAAE
ncbi:MAG: hypothetical protein K0M49_00960 [Arenimonas sp.]|nr:hypothetical protein [Rhizobium sp.]MBW8444175.1 hypothetical protein [Arenimonas sp.]